MQPYVVNKIRSLIKLGKYKNTLGILRSEGYNPNDFHVKVLKAQCHKGLNKYDAALSLLLPILKDKEFLSKSEFDKVLVYVPLAHCYVGKGEYEHAENIYGELLQNKEFILNDKPNTEWSEDKTFLMGMGSALQIGNKFEEAIKVYNLVLKTNHNDVEATNEIAICKVNLKKVTGIKATDISMSYQPKTSQEHLELQSEKKQQPLQLQLSASSNNCQVIKTTSLPVASVEVTEDVAKAASILQSLKFADYTEHSALPGTSDVQQPEPHRVVKAESKADAAYKAPFPPNSSGQINNLTIVNQQITILQRPKPASSTAPVFPQQEISPQRSMQANTTIINQPATQQYVKKNRRKSAPEGRRQGETVDRRQAGTHPTFFKSNAAAKQQNVLLRPGAVPFYPVEPQQVVRPVAPPFMAGMPPPPRGVYDMAGMVLDDYGNIYQTQLVPQLAPQLAPQLVPQLVPVLKVDRRQLAFAENRFGFLNNGTPPMPQEPNQDFYEQYPGC